MSEMALYDARGRPVLHGRRIGGGGEGDVYLVTGQPVLVAKVYAKPTPRLRDKLTWMIDHPPEARQERTGHTTLAWPVSLVFSDRAGAAFAGFLMPRIAGAVPLLQVFNPRLRARTLPGFDRRYLARTARNLAAVLATLHDAGYVVGDLNESNVLVTPSALVAIIDCDSFQVQARRGTRTVIHPCPVGKPEYTAPELQGKPFGTEVRKAEADRFALGVLIFQLLMEGRHPFGGTWMGSGEPPALEEKIRRGFFPYANQPSYPLAPPPNAPPLTMLPRPVVELIRQCFVAGQRDPARRPTPGAWRDTLGQTEAAVGKSAPVRLVAPPAPAPVTPRPASQSRLDLPAPVTRPPRARPAVPKARAAAKPQRPSRGRRVREVLATLVGILLILTLTVGTGWWLLDHFGLLSLAAPGAETPATNGSPRGPVSSSPATNAGVVSACTPGTAAAEAATAAAVPRATYTPLAGSWVASDPVLHIRFYGMPWWDERPALSRGARYAVGYVPDSGDFDALDVLRVPATGSATGSAMWQSELDAYTHKGAATAASMLNRAAIGGVVVTGRPRAMKVAGYDGYLGQFHFTEDGARQMDATLWVGQVGCDRVILLFVGTPARDRQIDAAVAQVLATLDFSA